MKQSVSHAQAGGNMSKKSAPSSKRQARNAAQEAALKAQEEQAARDRRNQTIIGIIVVAVVVALVAVVSVVVWRQTHPQADPKQLEEAYAKVEAAKKPSLATDKGGFIISKNGVNKPVKDAPTVESYMDFMCPGCGGLERSTGDTFDALVQAGQINLEVHPMAFMDRFSSDEYSTRTANIVVELAEKDPEHLLPMIQSLYAADFQPEEGNYKPVTNEMIRERAISVGVPEKVADEITNDKYEYKDWVRAISDYTPLRSELWNTTGQLKGSMSTPTVLINGKFWNRTAVPTDIDPPTAFLKAIGLNADQVGKAGAMPEVGTDKGPLYPES